MRWVRSKGPSARVTFCVILLIHLSIFIRDAVAAPQLMSWKDTAQIEHIDRVNRMKRLSDRRYTARPEFYEYLISRDHLPQFGIDIKVLRVVFSQGIFFDTDKSDVREEALAILDLVADSLRKDVPDVAVFVAGHTDSRGSDEHNYELSVRRADSVSRALFARNVGLARMWRVGFGEAVPVFPNTTPDNMAKNRRVEFLFAAKPEAVTDFLASQTSRCTPGSPPSDFCRPVAVPIDRVDPPKITPKAEREAVDIKVEAKVGNMNSTMPSQPGRASSAEIVEIGRSNPVVIDLTEKRVQVGRPLL